MNQNFLICLEAVLPMFILLAIGYCVRLTRIVNDSELTKMNSLAFRVLFPFLMFNNVYGSDISQAVNTRMMLFTLIAIGVIYLVATIFTLRIEKTPTSRGAMIQAIYRSNFVIMGLPLATNIYGHGNIGVTAIMVAVVVPVYNVLAVITLEIYRRGRISVLDIIRRVLTNPLIIGAVVGIAFVLAGIKLPAILDETVDTLSATATPIAILILGASFRFSSLKNKPRNLIISVFARLILIPGVVLTIAMFLGFKDIYFVTLVGIFAAPCALSSYTMARDMNSDYELAGNTVVFTSALCCFTMFGWLLLFKTLGVF